MSRVGKSPIKIPEGVKVTYNNKNVTVKGSKGTIEKTIHPCIDLDIQDQVICVAPVKDTRKNRAFQGLTRSLVANMVIGVDKGFERILQINGLGYRASAEKNSILFNLGYSHPINFELPDGVSATVDKQNQIILSGIDKEKVGQTAASIRQLMPPEPYKGKGIKYADENIQRKAGKTGTK